MDFIIARIQDSYGYMSTGTDKSHGFSQSLKEVFTTLENKDNDYTYASPMELPLMEHQRDWTKRDSVYLNKLKHFHQEEGVELAMLMLKAQMSYRR